MTKLKSIGPSPGKHIEDAVGKAAECLKEALIAPEYTMVFVWNQRTRDDGRLLPNFSYQSTIDEAHLPEVLRAFAKRLEERKSR